MYKNPFLGEVLRQQQPTHPSRTSKPHLNANEAISDKGIAQRPGTEFQVSAEPEAIAVVFGFFDLFNGHKKGSDLLEVLTNIWGLRAI